MKSLTRRFSLSELLGIYAILGICLLWPGDWADIFASGADDPGALEYDPFYGCDNQGKSKLYIKMRVAWGDLHSHTTYSYDAIEKEGCMLIPAEAIASARDDSHLDFVAITDHAEEGAPGYYTQEKWDNMIVQETAATGIVVFPAFEYTKTVAPLKNKKGIGHKNIICRDFAHLPPRGYGFDHYDLPTQLWAWLNTTAAKNNYICIPHHPAKGSDYENPRISMSTDWSESYVSSIVQPLVEIYSRHGSSEMKGCEERVNDFDDDLSVESALKKWLTTHYAGYKLGLIGSTDTHFGKPGDTVETSENVDQRLGYWTGGLAAVWVSNVNRTAIWNNLKAKNCYATSGNRMTVEFTIKCNDKLSPMGSTITHTGSFEGAPVPVYIHIRASNSENRKITKIQIYKNGALLTQKTSSAWLSTVHIDYEDSLDLDHAYYRVKVWQKSTNNLPQNQRYERAWSSPIWIEKS